MSRHALTAAKKVGGEISCLVAGAGDVAGVASEVASINGLAKVLVVSSGTVLACSLTFSTSYFELIESRHRFRVATLQRRQPRVR